MSTQPRKVLRSSVFGSEWWRKKPRFLHLRPLLGALLIGLLAFFGAYQIQQVERDTNQQRDRIFAEKRLKEAAATLSLAMKVRLSLTNSLVAYVNTHRDFTQQDFDRFASMLQRGLQGVLSLQLAPGGVVTYLTDLERNRKALGHDLFADPKRRVIAERSVRERSYIIAGPINLVQGGRAIIARRPMFFPDQDGENETFWGFAIILIDIDQLLQDALSADLNKDFLVAIRGKDGLGAEGEIFFGSQSTFDAAIAITDVALPDASWQLAATAKTQHLAKSFMFTWWYGVASIVVSLTSVIVAYLIIDGPRQLRCDVNRATKNLQREILIRKTVEKKIRYMAQHDPLTGLPNRRLFDELANLSLATAKRKNLTQALLFIDIDDFKTVNDTFGHGAGDRLLQMAAGRLSERVRESDVVARFGGDEFMVLLIEKCDAEGAKMVAGEIVNTMSKPFDMDGCVVRVGVSIGVALYPDHGTTIGELVRNADIAMYTAKQHGKNGYGLADPGPSESKPTGLGG